MCAAWRFAALELVEDRNPRDARLWFSTRENPLRLGKAGMYGNVIRISPPMNITTDVDQFIELLDRSLSARRATASGKAR